MTINRQRTEAVRRHMAANPGMSHTEAIFAVKAQRAQESAPNGSAKPERPDVSHLYGHLVVARGPRRRTRSGLLLPPAPGSRSALPRLQSEGESDAARFDPAGYTVEPVFGAAALSHTHRGRPVYRHAELPGTALLATKTTLFHEMRRKPADPESPLAYFYSKHGDGYFALYSTVDAIALPELSPKRQAAWNAARTCADCGKTNSSPLPNQITAAQRYCQKCWPDARAADFVARQRPIQLQQAEWATQVLADPDVILAGHEILDRSRGRRFLGLSRTRIENLAGEVLLDVLVALPYCDQFDLEDPVERALFESLTPADERRRAVAALRGRRLVTFDKSRSYFLDDGENHFPVAEHDHASSRYACWYGYTCSYAGDLWRPADVIDLNHPTDHRRSHPFELPEWEKLDAAGKIELTRKCLRVIAGDPPAPTYERSR